MHINYDFDRILSKAIHPRTGKEFYLIKWTNYDIVQSTWEPVENINSPSQTIVPFNKSLDAHQFQGRDWGIPKPWQIQDSPSFNQGADKGNCNSQYQEPDQQEAEEEEYSQEQDEYLEDEPDSYQLMRQTTKKRVQKMRRKLEQNNRKNKNKNKRRSITLASREKKSKKKSKKKSTSKNASKDRRNGKFNAKMTEIAPATNLETEVLKDLSGDSYKSSESLPSRIYNNTCLAIQENEYYP